MKNKLLFYLNADFTHFAIAYFLQQKYDCEIYAIIDITDKPKEFFLKQKLVNFKKIWFVHDHVNLENDTVDLEYLKKIEDEFGIDLWKIIINDRIFYRFFNFHKFTRNELLSITEQLTKKFLGILNDIKPDFFISQQPALFHSELLYELAFNSETKCMLLSQPKFGGKALVSESVRRIDNIETLENLPFKNRTENELMEYLKNNSQRKIFKKYYENLSNSRLEFISAGLRYIGNNNKHEETHYTYFGRTKIKVIFSTLSGIIKKKIRERYMRKKLPKEFREETPYAYFPLAVDMERNVLIDAPFYTNQIEIIRTVAKSLPINFKLVIKENPGQVSREWRKISEYKEIVEIPNTIFIHPEYPSEKLIRDSSLVISLAGSTPLEAAFYQKPAIVFGDVVYSLIPSIIKAEKLEQLPELIKRTINTKVDSSYLNRFIDLIEKSAVNFDMFGFQTKFNSEFYYQGSLFDVDIEEERLKKFLISTKDDFDEIVNHHIKKIDEFKK